MFDSHLRPRFDSRAPVPQHCTSDRSLQRILSLLLNLKRDFSVPDSSKVRFEFLLLFANYCGLHNSSQKATEIRNELLMSPFLGKAGGGEEERRETTEH
jgi:hypothetical protein